MIPPIALQRYSETLYIAYVFHDSILYMLMSILEINNFSSITLAIASHSCLYTLFMLLYTKAARKSLISEQFFLLKDYAATRTARAVIYASIFARDQPRRNNSSRNRPNNAKRNARVEPIPHSRTICANERVRLI